MNATEPVKVGILGQGRSGWGIHAKAIQNIPEQFIVRAVYDPITERCSESATALDARACDSAEQVLADDEIEMVIVASPNPFHAEQTIAALKAGKHVLCEKPFGLTVADVDAMITASQQAGRVLQPFQQRRYEPDFLKVKEICDSGILGRIRLIRICWHGFKRRWDWQTLRSMCGGELNNNGPHPIDHAIQLFGDPEPHVWCQMDSCLCSGDAEDDVKMILYGNGPTIEVELSSSTAYGQDRWMVAGTCGGLRGDANGLEWKWVDWSKMPDRPVSDKPTPDRSYNKEELAWQTDSWKPAEKADTGGGAAPSPKPVLQLYDSLFAAIRLGKPQAITPQSVRPNVGVMEKCRAAAAAVDQARA